MIFGWLRVSELKERKSWTKSCRELRADGCTVYLPLLLYLNCWLELAILQIRSHLCANFEQNAQKFCTLRWSSEVSEIILLFLWNKWLGLLLLWTKFRLASAAGMFLVLPGCNMGINLALQGSRSSSYFPFMVSVQSSLKMSVHLLYNHLQLNMLSPPFHFCNEFVKFMPAK